MTDVRRSKLRITFFLLFCSTVSLTYAQTAAEQQLWEECGSLRNTADICACFQRYLNAYPDGNWSSQARRQLDQCPTYDRITFRKCETATDVDSIVRYCRDYVEEFPDGQYAGQARRRLADLEKTFWRNVSQDRRNERLLIQYQDYFPDGPHLAEVSSQLDYIQKARSWSPQRLWQEETNGKGVQRLEDFIAFYGDNPLADNARQQIALINARTTAPKVRAEETPEQQAYARVSNSQNPAALRRFLADYPKSSYAQTVQQRLARLDEEAWRAAEDFNTEAAYRQYAQNFPNGAYMIYVEDRIASSKSSAVDDAWVRATNTGTEDAYMDFIENYPRSKYITAARDSISSVNVIESRKNITDNGEFIITFQNAANLRIQRAPDPDSVFLDDSSLASGNILKGIILKSGPEFIVEVRDEKGKVCVVNLIDDPRVVAVIPQMPQTDPDTIRIRVRGGKEPYTVEFIDTTTQLRAFRAENIPADSLYVLAGRAFASLNGIFDIVIKDQRRQGKATASAGIVTFSQPFYQAYMGILIGAVGLILALFVWRFVYRRYIKTDEIDPYEGFVEEAFDTG